MNVRPGRGGMADATDLKDISRRSKPTNQNDLQTVANSLPVNLLPILKSHPELLRTIEAWPKLAPAVRQSIVAMVETEK